MESKLKKRLYRIIKIVFVFYLLVLIRVILFKDAPLYNLFGGIGLGLRSVSIVPFASIIDMIFDNTISLARLIQNIGGNIVLFIPLGIFIPLIFNKSNKAVILSGFAISLCFEVFQFIFTIGNSDVDDIILNVLGTIIGFFIFKFISKISKNGVQILATSLVFFIVAGGIGSLIVLKTNSDLLKFKPTERIVLNEQIIKDLDEKDIVMLGEIKSFDDSELTIEEFIPSSEEKAKVSNVSIVPETKIVLENCKQEFFFNTLVKETTDYATIEYIDFISHYNNYKGCTVKIWSENVNTADTVIVHVWSE